MVTILPSIGFTKRILFFGVILIATVSSSLIFFAKVEARGNNAHWILSITAAVAASIAIAILYQQKRHTGFIEKADLALAIALVLSLCAAILWAVYEIILEVVPPVPSLADALSITAYAFLSFYVFSTYLRFYKVFHFSKKQLIAAVIASTIFLFFIILYTVSLVEISSSRGLAILSIIVAYPVLDAIIMVPSFLIVVNYRKEPQWFTPWICKSAGILLVVIADSWFDLFVVTSLTNELWPSAMIFAASRVIIAAGLLWSIVYLVTPRTTANRNTNSSNNFDSSARITSSEFNKSTRTGKAWSSNLAFVAITGLSVFSVIFIIGTALSSSSSSSFFPFSNPGSEVILPPAPAGALKQQIVTIGALIPITGVSSSLGESEGAALKIATKDINEYLFKTNSSIGIKLVIEDTQTNPSVSLEKLKHLAAKGIKIVIGPATSEDLKATQDYADKNGIVLISPSATATSLAIKGNNVFRFVPDDTHQAQAISKLMWDDGIRVVIPFWRTDVYGNDLVKATKQSVEELGGRVADGVGYIPNTGDFAASLNRINFIVWDQDLKALDSKVNQAISQHGVDKVGVYSVAYDEIAPIFIQALNHPTLSKVKWFGSDKETLNNKIIRNTEAAAFAVKTNFTTPIYAVENDNDERLKHIEDQIHEQIERTPRSYASVAYDTLWVAALAENNTKATHDINYLKNTIVKIAHSYQGITGNTTLNQFGDRKYGDYDFWAVRNSESTTHDSFIWKRIGKYVPNIRTE
jgi:ABC-type branched-subunit amino acid transport system substrate-binding protein